MPVSTKHRNRHIVKAKRGRKVDVTGEPFSAGYSNIYQHWFHQPIDLPPFSFATIRGMLMDPEIKLNFAMRAAPVVGAEFGWYEGEEFIEGVKCKHPEVAEFLFKQLQHIWKNFLPAILRAQIWGWSGGEVVMKLGENNLIEIDTLEPRHASDVRLLKQGFERWGISVDRVEDRGTALLPFPYSWFHAYNAEDGDDYGLSAAHGAYSPWADKWFNGGAKDVRRLFMHKDAYGGVDLGYPEGETWVEGIEQPVQNRDIARQIVEQLRSGGVVTRPSARDEDGNEKWPLQRAQTTSSPQHILDYPKDLDTEIRHGMEIPDGVVDDSGAAAWAGKRVTIAGFYASLDQWVVQILSDLKYQIFDHLCLLNFGSIPTYELCHKPLAEQAMEQQSNAGPGGEMPPGQDIGGMAPPDMQGPPGMPAMDPSMAAPQQPAPPMVMSVAKSIGTGELTAVEAMEAVRRVVRLSMAQTKEDEPGDDEYEMTPERIEALADLLAAVYGDQAEEMLDEILPEGKPLKLAVWNPDDHPRGPDGRCITRGTDAAFATAKEKVDAAHRSRSADSMSDLMTHLNTLTVKQLHKLKREYGTQGSAKNKAALMAKLSERLTSGRHRTARRDNDTPVAPVREEVYTVPTDSLQVDPKRFQYKVKGIGEKGVGQELKGTSKWNPELGGVLLVWRDPENGNDYVVNGHHRHELASRADAGQLNVRYIDAGSAKIARSVGALANIAEGRGTAIDAAKYLRDSGQDVEHLRSAGISMSGKIASEAEILTRLSDKTFGAVTQGLLEEDQAVAVAKHLTNHDLQDKLFKRLRAREDDGKEWTLRETEQAAKKMAKAGTVKESGTDLFGAWETEESTFDQEVEIESYISRLLAQEANDYAAVASTRRAERVADAGNVLATEENLSRRDAARSILSDFDRESGLKGDTSAAIQKHAARLATAKNRKEREAIKKDALEDVRRALAERDLVEPASKFQTAEDAMGDWMNPQAVAMSIIRGDSNVSDWKLSEQEAAEVEQEAKKILKLGDTDQDAVMMSLRRLETENRILRMRLQPGATKQIGGTTYILNENHRWTLPKEGGQQAVPQRTAPTTPASKPSRQDALAKTGSKERPMTDVPKTKIDSEETTAPPPGDAFMVNVEEIDDETGVSKSARVGVPGRVTPPPPKVPRLPNLTKDERAVESKFISAFEADPSGMANKYRQHVYNSDKPYTFETDAAKLLSDDWVDTDQSKQMQKRAMYNNALHQTANAITKKAFLAHLDTLQAGDNVLVTVGGCGAGKGYTLKNTEKGKGLASSAKAVWDSAGDQNATENPWILEEATKRGLKVQYAYIAGDAKVAWAHPDRGIVQRAHNPEDGRMVDAAVFADSYVMGAKNHHAFHQANKDNPNAEFLFFNATDQSELPGVPEDSLNQDRKALYHWALGSIQSRSDVMPTIMRGGVNGSRIWNQEFFGGQDGKRRQKQE